MGQAKRRAGLCFDIDVPALLAFLAPVELGGQRRRGRGGVAEKTSEAAIGVSRFSG